jgi:hypothetical protein
MGKREGKRALGRSRNRWEDIMALKGTVCEEVAGLIWHKIGSSAWHLWTRTWNFLNNSVTITFSRRQFSDVDVRIRVSSVSIVTGYGLKNRGLIPSRVRHFSLRYLVQNRSLVHPLPIQWVQGSVCPRVQRPDLEADHSRSPILEFKSARNYNPISLHGMVLRHRDTLSFFSLCMA